MEIRAPERSRASMAMCLLMAALLSGAIPERLHAANPASEGGPEEHVACCRLYLGLWTLHFEYPGRGLENNRLLGLAVGKIYGATFINTFGDRSYSAGFQDVIAHWTPELASISIGYRLGLVTGYDERFIRIAGRMPVLPVVQPRLLVEREHLGMEISYSGVVASAGFVLRF